VGVSTVVWVRAWVALAPLWLAALGFLCFTPGLTGGWFFDDEPSLSGLLAVFSTGRIEWGAAIDYVFSGIAGPLGRPLSLFTFLVDGSAWPHSPGAMLYTNVLLHLLNAMLVLAVVMRLCQFMGWTPERQRQAALFVTLLWLLLPLHVSSVLVTVQRMTLLSSLLMLIGVWTHLWLRARLETAPVRMSALIVLSLGFWTVCGMFAKEQAVLLPLLVWVLESTLLPRPRLGRRHAQVWTLARALALIGPSLLVMAYLVRVWLHAEQAYALRDFDWQQRLLSEGVILWRYLLLIFLPRASALGPFHDDVMPFAASVGTILTVWAWLLAFAVALWQRRRTPLLAFGLLWFLAAHLLESTVLPLELYFEHRNYLASLGPIIVLVLLVQDWAYRVRRQGQGAAVLVGYAALMALVLLQTTSRFGNPALAAELWVVEHPGSTRAVQYLAQSQVMRGDVDVALRVVDAGAKAQPEASDLLLQGLQLECALPNPDEAAAERRYHHALTALPEGRNRFSVLPTLDKLKVLMNGGACPEVLTRTRLEALAEAALRNPKVIAFAQNQSNLNLFTATLAIDAGDLDAAMSALERALAAVVDYPTLVLAMAVLNSAGLPDLAQDVMNRYPVPLPRNPIMRKRLQAQLAALQAGQTELVLEREKNRE